LTAAPWGLGQNCVTCLDLNLDLDLDVDVDLDLDVDGSDPIEEASRLL
jgi:hypothetical protein